MKANSKKTNVNIIENKLKKIPLNRLSKNSGFCKRKSRKIKPKDFLLGFFIMAFSNENNSYRNWATKIGQLSNQTISKQALWKRMHEGQILFLEKLIKFIIRQKVKQSQRLKKSKGLNQFRNILLEDSTHIKINNKLSKYYPGNGNGDKGADKAVIKIQTVYNLLKDKFEKLEITSYRKNDQSVSDQILRIAKKGDLIIRDLGYFVLKAFSKLKNGINIISKDTEKPIDLAKMLKKRGELDIEVLLGEKEKLPVRIIAIPLEEAVAANRRRKARQDRDRRMNPGKKRLFLLGWEIFITNVSGKKLSFKEISDIYIIRWRIEIIFKSWKSYFKITTNSVINISIQYINESTLVLFASLGIFVILK